VILYFDNCVWLRKFDNLKDEKIVNQQRDIQEILNLRREGRVQIASSDAVEAELMPLLDKNMEREKERIMAFVDKNSDARLPTAYNRLDSPKWARLGVMRLAGKEMTEKVKELINRSFKHDDAVHIATAIEGKADFFITVDEDIQRKSPDLNEIKIVYPSEVLKYIIRK